MAKFITRIRRKDSADHTHRMPNGEMTGPMLMKPDFKHSHSYVCEDSDVKETSIALTGVDHNHETIYGKTGGAVDIKAKESEAPRDREAKDQSGIIGGVHNIHKADSAHMDKIVRQGSKWLVLSESGHKLGEHPTQEAALKQLKAVEFHKNN